MAAQLIVLHHVSAYAPFGEASGVIWAAVMGWLYDYGRMAVQVFLVISGFLVAQAIDGWENKSAPVLLGQRYVRLMPLLVAALFVTVLTVAASRPWLDAQWLPEFPTLGQFFAHLVLAQDWLNVPALSAGVWYVAIDFQLYALVVILVVVFRSQPFGVFGCRAALVVLSIASMLFFNRDAAYDFLPVYFFAAYGLGLFAAWSGRDRASTLVFLALCAVAIISLALDFRLRLLLALLVAVILLMFAGRRLRGLEGAILARLSNGSYGVFLFHFAVIVAASAAWSAFGVSGASSAGLFTAAVLVISNAVGVLMHEQFECRLRRLFF